jgi:hypothetical protein
VDHTWRWSFDGEANQWTLEEYEGDTASSGATLVKRTTLNRVDYTGGYSQSRGEEEIASDGSMQAVANVWEKFDTSTLGEPLLLEKSKYREDGSEVNTKWTYNLNRGTAGYRCPTSLRRNDGFWKDYQYSSQGTILTVKEVSSWLNSPAGVEASAKVITTVNDYGPSQTVSSWEEKVAGTVVAGETITRVPWTNGAVKETKTVKAAPADLVTVTEYYPGTTYQDMAVATSAEARRAKSISNPDGTVVLYSYSQNANGATTTTEAKGAGSKDGVTDGTRTVSKEDSAGNLLERVVTDIKTGLETERMTADVSSLDTLGRPQKYNYFNDPNDFSIAKYGCCRLESTRDRNGKETSFIYDGLKRKTHEISGYQEQIQENLATTYKGTATTETKSAGTQSVLVRAVTRTLAGELKVLSTPDANGDGAPEDTTTAHSTLPGGGHKETTIYPDGGRKRHNFSVPCFPSSALILAVLIL